MLYLSVLNLRYRQRATAFKVHQDMFVKDRLKQIIDKVRGRQKRNFLNLKLVSTVLILVGIALVIWSVVAIPTKQRNQYEESLMSLFKERDLALYSFTNSDFGYKRGIITADEYKQAWRDLGSTLKSVKDREELLIPTGKEFGDERILLHHDGLGYIIEGVGIINGVFEDSSQESDPIGAANAKLEKGLQLINRAEGNNSSQTL